MLGTLFNSVSFLIFFPITTLIYFVVPYRLRWLHLLLASALFYMAFVPVYVLILAFTIVVDYFAGLWIAMTLMQCETTSCSSLAIRALSSATAA